MNGDYSWLSHFDLGLNWAVIIKWLPRLAQRRDLTLELVAIAVIAGLLLAIPGIARSSRLWYVRTLPYCYIFFFRGTPLLVQLFLVYYGLAQFDAVRESALWPLPAGPVLVRHRHHDPAHRRLHCRNHCVARSRPSRMVRSKRRGRWACPSPRRCSYHPARAARIGLPAYSNEVILMLKASALASTVTLLELTGMARTIIARTYLPVEIFFAAGMFYLLMAYVLVRGFKLLERWLRVDACQGPLIPG